MLSEKKPEKIPILCNAIFYELCRTGKSIETESKGLPRTGEKGADY
jgi:hypothetical protein